MSMSYDNDNRLPEWLRDTPEAVIGTSVLLVLAGVGVAIANEIGITPILLLVLSIVGVVTLAYGIVSALRAFFRRWNG